MNKKPFLAYLGLSSRLDHPILDKRHIIQFSIQTTVKDPFVYYVAFVSSSQSAFIVEMCAHSHKTIRSILSPKLAYDVGS